MVEVRREKEIMMTRMMGKISFGDNDGDKKCVV